MDIVYTWVDDSFPGYLEELNRHAADPRDLNPNRTRDNLEVVRYSLRSVARNCPWVRRVHFVTCRPQVPDWLNTDHPGLRVVHHDRIIPPEVLPTYNSFCIGSYLHEIPDVTPRFVYLEDDMLIGAPGMVEALFAPDGRPWLHQAAQRVDRNADPATASPWNLALAQADRALSERFMGGGRRHWIHGPQIRDVALTRDLIAMFSAEFAATRGARFRAADNVPPEFLLPHAAAEAGHWPTAPDDISDKLQGYVSIENFVPWTWLQLRRVRRRAPLSVTLNDSFGARPNPRAVALARRWLDGMFPDPSPYERK